MINSQGLRSRSPLSTGNPTMVQSPKDDDDEGSKQKQKRRRLNTGEIEESHHPQIQYPTLPHHKQKASNIPATSFSIGSWQRQSTCEGDLTMKIYYRRRKLIWEYLDQGFIKKKIEVAWPQITALNATTLPDQPGILHIELSGRPLFYQETSGEARNKTKWELTSDFTLHQASSHRIYRTTFKAGVLNEHLKKLLESDGRLMELSRKPFPSPDSSSYFDSSGSSSLDQTSPAHYAPTSIPYASQTLPINAGMGGSGGHQQQQQTANWVNEEGGVTHPAVFNNNHAMMMMLMRMREQNARLLELSQNPFPSQPYFNSNTQTSLPHAQTSMQFVPSHINAGTCGSGHHHQQQQHTANWVNEDLQEGGVGVVPQELFNNNQEMMMTQNARLLQLTQTALPHAPTSIPYLPLQINAAADMGGGGGGGGHYYQQQQQDLQYGGFTATPAFLNARADPDWLIPHIYGFAPKI